MKGYFTSDRRRWYGCDSYVLLRVAGLA